MRHEARSRRPGKSPTYYSEQSFTSSYRQFGVVPRACPKLRNRVRSSLFAPCTYLRRAADKFGPEKKYRDYFFENGRHDHKKSARERQSRVRRIKEGGEGWKAWLTFCKLGSQARIELVVVISED